MPFKIDFLQNNAQKMLEPRNQSRIRWFLRQGFCVAYGVAGFKEQPEFSNRLLHSGHSPFMTQLISSTSKSFGRGMLEVVMSLMQNVLWQEVQVKWMCEV